MDEIIFRGSQKLENLQIQLSLAAQQSKVLFQQYSERGSDLASQAWHSPRIVQVQDLAKEFVSWLSELIDVSKDVLLSVADPRNFVTHVIRLLRNEMTRRQLLWGCIGFVIGSCVGYSVACSIQRTPIFSCHMRAAVCTSYKGTESTSLIDDVPVPKIEESDDVLIQVRASSVSLIDVAVCQGYCRRLRKFLSKYNQGSKNEFPVILGRSCAGVVVEIGHSVSRFDIGDEVYLSAPYWAQGTIAESCVSKEFRIAHKPKRIGFEGASGLPYAGGVALNAISLAGITKNNAQGKRILVCSACTPVGCVLVQYCHLLGCEITATTNIKQAPVAQALGADDVIICPENNISKMDLEMELPKLLKKELELRDLFDVIFITDEKDLPNEQLKRYCKPHGKMISTLLEYLPSDNFGFVLGGLFWSYIRTKCLLQNIFGYHRSNYGEPEITYEHLETLSSLVDNQQLQSVVDKVFHPHDIELALDHVQSSDSIGSSIITFRFKISALLFTPNMPSRQKYFASALKQR